MKGAWGRGGGAELGTNCLTSIHILGPENNVYRGNGTPHFISKPLPSVLTLETRKMG